MTPEPCQAKMLDWAFFVQCLPSVGNVIFQEDAWRYYDGLMPRYPQDKLANVGRETGHKSHMNCGSWHVVFLGIESQ